MRTTILCLLWLTLFNQCKGQENNPKMKNPLLCEPEKGSCELPTSNQKSDKQDIAAAKKMIKIIYFTDPICSACWGIEPQLRKLKLEYGDAVEVEYHMGGLLPDWSYNSGGISKPSDVAPHWDEVSHHYDMPIDGDVWLEDPLHSSYPPSIAFKAAQLQNEEKALLFLRKMREMLFLQKKNIAKWEQMAVAAAAVGLDTVELKKNYETTAQTLFQTDLQLARKMGVRGFPTLFFADTLNNQQLVYGVRPYEHWEQIIRKMAPTVTKKSYNPDWSYLFAQYPTLTNREFSELSGKNRQESETLLQELVEQGKLTKLSIKNGTLWLAKP